MPPAKWMNEPHAPLWYAGLYHIFYQANPHAPVWDNICWGHLVSRDMVRWEDAGIALSPDQGEPLCDPDGCWSGSACLDDSGLPVVFYTAGNNMCLPNQSVAAARPADCGDPRLRVWKKEGVLLRQDSAHGFLGEFRDPFVFYRDGFWFLLVGTGAAENGGGNAMLYRSTDLRSFEPVGFLLEYDYSAYPAAGHVWELPVLLPLRDETGRHACDIFTFCACQIESDTVEVYYYLGHFDSAAGVFRRTHSQPRLFDLGHGVFTGGAGFVTPDNRTVYFTIAQGMRSEADQYASGWAHNGGLPLELSLREKELSVCPVRELNALFSPIGVYEENDALPDWPILEGRIRITCTGERMSLFIASGSHTWRIEYDRSSGLWTAHLDGACQISRTQREEDRVRTDGREICMECYFDHSMAELYLNARKSMTLRSYSAGKGYRVRVACDGKWSLAMEEYRKIDSQGGEA